MSSSWSGCIRQIAQKRGAPQVLEHTDFLTPLYGHDAALIRLHTAAYRSCSSIVDYSTGAGFGAAVAAEVGQDGADPAVATVAG